MTTIIYDGVSVYADTQVTSDELKSQLRKVHRVKTSDGPRVVAVAGEIAVMDAVIAAIKEDRPYEHLVTGNSTVLVVGPAGARVVSGKKSWPDTAPIFLGSGSAAARGAYEVCKDAAKSIRAACRVDLYSSEPVHRVKA